MCSVCGPVLGPFQDQNLRFGGSAWVSGQTGFALSQIEVGGFKRFWRQNWSVLCVLRLGAGFGAIPGAESAIWGVGWGFGTDGRVFL